mgnify:CR=1 FL=1
MLHEIHMIMSEYCEDAFMFAGKKAYSLKE